MKGSWKTATIDIDRASEFTGDDVDRFSSLISLEADYENVLVVIPALSSSAVVSLYIQTDASIASVPVQMQVMDSDATGHHVLGTSSGAGSVAIVFHVGAVQYFRVHCGANQAADRAFTVRGC
uniref:Uncharacterized protein n=1 Tax=viral metagenome TaxID=1070528 RepID=A0A6M3KBB1_9ZZZZ